MQKIMGILLMSSLVQISYAMHVEQQTKTTDSLKKIPEFQLLQYIGKVVLYQSHSSGSVRKVVLKEKIEKSDYYEAYPEDKPKYQILCHVDRIYINS